MRPGILKGLKVIYASGMSGEWLHTECEAQVRALAVFVL